MRRNLRHWCMAASAITLMVGAGAVRADEAAAKKWIDSEFQPSTLSKEDQLKEMQWFMKAAEPFKGMEINQVSETTLTSMPANGFAALMNHCISFIWSSFDSVEG
jgi:hypothetical protein